MVFYAPLGVGSENWKVETVHRLWNSNGKLCEA